MDKIGFLGAFEKTDLIMYTAKVLNDLGKKVMVIDASKLQKMKYIVPTIENSNSYVTTFENIDFAIGFDYIDEIEEYLGVQIENGNGNSEYDFVLIDTDDDIKFDSFEMNTAKQNYFVTGFDLYSLNQGLNLFHDLEGEIKLTKILFSYDSVTKEEEDYLNNLSLNYKINWNNEYTLFFTIFSEDSQTIQENQRLEQIKFKKLSQDYKSSLAYLVQDIDKSQNLGQIKKMMKE